MCVSRLVLAAPLISSTFNHQANMIDDTQYKSNRNNNYSTDKKHPKLNSDLDTCLAHDTLDKEKLKYS